MQVGVADPAGVDLHDGLARAGVGHDDVDELDVGALAAGDDALDGLGHEVLPVVGHGTYAVTLRGGACPSAVAGSAVERRGSRPGGTRRGDLRHWQFAHHS